MPPSCIIELTILIIGVRMALTLEAGQREISTFDSRMIGACVIGGRGKKAPAKMRGKTHNNTRETFLYLIL